MAQVRARPEAIARGRSGHVVYSLGGKLYQISAEAEANPTDVSAALDTIAAADAPRDNWINISPDGQWLLVETSRFADSCASWACVQVVSSDVTAGETVVAGGKPLRPESRSAIASGGMLIVYPSRDGPNDIDLWVTRRDRRGWGSPDLLTEGSPGKFNAEPAISDDGKRVVFDCGREPYHGPGTCVCEVDIAEPSVRKRACFDEPPPGTEPGESVHSGDYAPDGSLVFEADWGGGEQIWRLPAGGGAAARVAPSFHNDNSPCVLPDGRIASLWLQRPGGGNAHELRVMTADGKTSTMLVLADVEDIGLGCGK